MRAFKAWMTNQGYAVGTINRRLVTIKKYAALAFDGGAIDETEHARMRLVKGISLNAGKNLDDNREAAGQATRIGNKKSKHVTITPRQADVLRQHPDTPQGRRDEVLLRLLLDMGLRCGEVRDLTVDNVNLERATLTFYRSKVKLEQTHNIPADLFEALQRYDLPEAGALVLGSHKTGQLTSKGMSDRAITKRVKYLGKMLLSS